MNNTERKTAKREQIKAERKAVTQLQKIVLDIVDTIGLDEEKMIKRIDSAMRSEYGRLNGMINLLASISNWPAEAGDGASVAENRHRLETEMKLDTMMLEDIRQMKGFHTFHDDELQTIEGVEPQYEDYEDYCQIFLEDLGLEAYKPTISKDIWDRNEAKAKEKTKESIAELTTALEDHKRLLEQKV